MLKFEYDKNEKFYDDGMTIFQYHVTLHGLFTPLRSTFKMLNPQHEMQR